MKYRDQGQPKHNTLKLKPPGLRESELEVKPHWYRGRQSHLASHHLYRLG